MRPARRLLLVAALVALPALAACGGGGGDDKGAADGGAVTASGPPAAQTAALHTTEVRKFSPATVHAKPGTLTLTMTNSTGVPHNLTFQDAALGKIDTFSEGSRTITLTLPAAGTFTFECTLHPGMDGQVVVG